MVIRVLTDQRITWKKKPARVNQNVYTHILGLTLNLPHFYHSYTYLVCGDLPIQMSTNEFHCTNVKSNYRHGGKRLRHYAIITSPSMYDVENSWMTKCSHKEWFTGLCSFMYIFFISSSFAYKCSIFNHFQTICELGDRSSPYQMEKIEFIKRAITNSGGISIFLFVW